MTPDEQAQLVSLAISFLIQAWPLVLAYESVVVQQLIDLLPGTPEQELVKSAHNIMRGIWADHPDWDDAQKRRYAVDAIELRAIELGANIAPDFFKTLGLS